MHFLEMDKDLLQFICRRERKTTSRICVLLVAKSGSVLQVSKQRGSKTKLEKESSLAMSHIPQEISFSMMMSPNNKKLQFIVSSTKDSMMFLSSHSVQMPSIYSVLPMVMISLRSKVLLMPLPNWNFISTPSRRSKPLLFMSHRLKMIRLLVSKWK